MPNTKKKTEEFNNVLKNFENLILTGRFRPGQRLVEAELIERLQVSRYWIRDALKILAEKGLVKILPYKGATVIDLSPKEIEDIFVIRVALERLAIHQAVEKLTPADLKKLKKFSDLFDQAHKRNETQQMIQHNTDFHDYLFNVADNPPLIQLITDLRTRLHIVRYAAWAAPQVLKKIVEEHKIILKALKDKDLKTLDIVCEKHISYSKNYYLNHLKTIEALING
jgi:DNA-binding GntR family transcriptional regulator